MAPKAMLVKKTGLGGLTDGVRAGKSVADAHGQLKESDRQTMKEILKQFNTKGVFLVPCGEMERWIPLEGKKH